MKITEGNRATLIVVCFMVAFNGIFLSVNGLFMLVAPLVWYDFVPGVTDTGFFNQHFISSVKPGTISPAGVGPRKGEPVDLLILNLGRGVVPTVFWSK